VRHGWLSALLLTGCKLSHGQLPVDAQANGDAVDAPRPNTAHARMIDITDGQVIGGPHVDFPVFVTLSANWLRTKGSAGDVESANGYDIVFSLDRDGTQRLAHEIEAYRGDSGDLVAWVKLPMLEPTTTLYIHYGDPAITTSQENVAGVWSGGYAGVWHLGTDLRDSLGTSMGTNTGSVDAAGRIERARSFDGLNNTVVLGSAADVDDLFKTGGTIEAWVRPDTFGEENRGRVLDKSNTMGGNDTSGWSFGLDTLNVPNGLVFAHTAASADGFWNATSVLSTNAWFHLAVTYVAGSVPPLMYVNGQPVATTVLQAMQGAAQSDAAHPLHIGSRVAGDRTFDGLIDEARLARVLRSPEWIATTYRNQNQPLVFYSITNEL
jgi:MSHA biogenesis protein MshQ